MAYPKFNNKHMEKALFNASDFTKWKDYSKKGRFQKPSKYILIYYPQILRHFIRKYKPRKVKIYRLITIYKYKTVGVVQMTGIGSPQAATVLEELIALGGKEFLNIGSAGGLESFGIFLCEKAYRDEGTSYHYVPHGDFAFPDKKLTEKFGKYLIKNNILFQRATTWTIDAPYRETRAEIKHYKGIGVKTVEMEAAALFSVAAVRKVKIASAFVVSDIAGEKKWDPQFDAKHVNQKLNMLFDVALETLLQN